jgi:hypothetical protein
MTTTVIAETRPNKTDAGNGSYGICWVIDASLSPLPDPRRLGVVPSVPRSHNARINWLHHSQF